MCFWFRDANKSAWIAEVKMTPQPSHSEQQPRESIRSFPIGMLPQRWLDKQRKEDPHGLTEIFSTTTSFEPDNARYTE
jgi:hypothetical protein